MIQKLKFEVSNGQVIFKNENDVITMVCDVETFAVMLAYTYAEEKGTIVKGTVIRKMPN